MSQALALAAVLAWAIGAVTMLVAAGRWIRAGRRRLLIVAFAGGLLAEVLWLAAVARDGLGILLDPRQEVGLNGWGAWAVGIGGLAALISGLKSGARERAPDRAAEIAIGLFGTGVLLRQLALLL